MTTTHDDDATTNELANGRNGRWLGQRGIFRHYAPDVDSIDLKEWPDEIAFHTMSTSVAHWDNDVRGQLIRCVGEGEVSYEARINGNEETYGFSDIAAFSIDKLAAIAKVCNDLRYEWAQITGLHEGVIWSVL
jgi:hypothetical protein